MKYVYSFVFLACASWNITIQANLLMISKEYKLQVSQHHGREWTSYDIGHPVDYIDFFDTYYNFYTHTLYIVGFDTREGYFVSFSSKNGKDFNKGAFCFPLAPIRDNSFIEFLKIRPSFEGMNIFGRINHQDSSEKENIHFIKPYGQSIWFSFIPFLHINFPENRNFIDEHAFQYNRRITVLDMLVAPDSTGEYKKHMILMMDPYPIGNYPFYASNQGKTSVIVSDDLAFVPSSQSGWGFLAVGDRYPTLYQHPETHHSVLFRENKHGIHAQYLSTKSPTKINTDYHSFGTMLFATSAQSISKQLFFLAHTTPPLQAQAVIAYGSDITSLQIAQPIDESLRIDSITRQTGINALQHGGFYRFIEEHGHFLFFLSYVDDTSNQHLSLVLESYNGLLWNHLAYDEHSTFPLLPRTVRSIINIPDSFH